VKVIYGTNENSTTGICDAVSEMGKSGQVKVIGFNASDKEVAYIEDGTLTGTIVQNPYNMGYLGVKYADAAIKKQMQTVPPEMITSVALVTEENLNQDDIKFLINPTAD
jgi:ribose transport system substrate-binding protein